MAKSRKSEAEKSAQRIRTENNKLRTQKRVEKKLAAAKARKERKAQNG